MDRRSKAAIDWQEGTLRQVIAALPGFGDDAAVLVPDGDTLNDLSFADLSTEVARLTSGLVNEGMGAGTRIAIVGPNSPQWVIACLAAINAGATAIPLDPRLDHESFAHVLGNCRPDVIFASSDARSRVAAAASHRYRMICLDDGDSEVSSWRALRAEPCESLPDLSADAPPVIFYTSGTTGPPKGVPLSHRNLLFELARLRGLDLISPGERLLVPLPLYHVYPFVIGMLGALVYGAGIVFPKSLTGPQILGSLRTAGVGVVIGVPRFYDAFVSGIEERIAGRSRVAGALYRGLLRASVFSRKRTPLRPGRFLFRPLHRLVGDRLRLAVSGGAALDPALAWTLEGLGWTVAAGYGLTETAPMLSMLAPGDTRFETVGQPVAGVEVRIGHAGEGETDDPGTTAVEAGPGEILVRGPNVFSGYLDLPEHTAEAFSDDGWFRTGDRGAVDASGYLSVFGRAASFVVTPAGENISLESLEQTYERHPWIKEVGIFMRARALLAVIVPDTAALRAADIDSPDTAIHNAVQEWAQKLPSFERLSDFAVSRNALARTRLGKIRRNELEERYDALRSAGTGSEAAAPVRIEDMSGEDQALLEDPSARKVWEYLAERFADQRLSPDSDVRMDLGADSLEWINFTLDIRDRAGVELNETETAEIETVRDLLGKVAERAGQEPAHPADWSEDPERYLTAEQKRWLEPLSAFATAAAWLLYHVNRWLVRAFFRLRVSGLEHVPAAGNVVIAPNHTSVLDPFVIGAALPYRTLRRTCFAGWTGIAFANPLYRLVSRLARALPVRPDRAAFSSLAFALVMLRRGWNLVWFPEGARSPDGMLRDFRPGIGVLLSHHESPVVPVSIRGAFEAMPRGRRIPRPRRIEIVFGNVCQSRHLAEVGEGEDEPARIIDALRTKLAKLQRRAAGRDDPAPAQTGTR